MEHAVKRIIKRKLNLPDFVEPSSVYLNGNGSFYLSVGVGYDKKIHNNLSTENFKLLFSNLSITTHNRYARAYSEADFDYNEVIGDEEEKNKNETSLLIEVLESIAEFDDNLFNIKINDSNDAASYSFYDLKFFKMHGFKSNKHSKEILKDISDEIIEYYIRDYVFIESGLSINDNDIKNFIRAFYQTNCNPPFHDSDDYFWDHQNMFSDDFKDFIHFETEEELRNISELLKINFEV